MTKYAWGYPITSAQFCWMVLKEIDSPIVGDLETYSEVAYAIQYCNKDEVYPLLSGGEKHLVDIATSIWTGRNQGDGITALSGLDKDKRRKVWIGLGYLLLGRDILNDPDLTGIIDWDKFKGGIPGVRVSSADVSQPRRATEDTKPL